MDRKGVAGHGKTEAADAVRKLRVCLAVGPVAKIAG